MPNLAEILRTGLPKDDEGIATDLKEAGMPASGVDRIASVIAAMASKLLEVLVPLFGSDSEQGKRILRAIRTLSPLTKGIRAEDIAAILKMLEGVVAKGSFSPETMMDMSKMMGMMGPAAGPPSPAPVPPEEEKGGPVPTPPGIRRMPGLGEILRERRT